jgi:hypothetical protein
MAEISIKAVCAECGDYLDTISEKDVSEKYSATVEVEIGPCEKCMDRKFEEGRENGKEE